jgi:hypothetical protein
MRETWRPVVSSCLEGAVVAGQLLLGEGQRPGDGAEHLAHSGGVAGQHVLDRALVDDDGGRVRDGDERGGAGR